VGDSEWWILWRGRWGRGFGREAFGLVRPVRVRGLVLGGPVCRQACTPSMFPRSFCCILAAVRSFVVWWVGKTNSQRCLCLLCSAAPSPAVPSPQHLPVFCWPVFSAAAARTPLLAITAHIWQCHWCYYRYCTHVPPQPSTGSSAWASRTPLA